MHWEINLGRQLRPTTMLMDRNNSEDHDDDNGFLIPAILVTGVLDWITKVIHDEDGYEIQRILMMMMMG